VPNYEDADEVSTTALVTIVDTHVGSSRGVVGSFFSLEVSILLHHSLHKLNLSQYTRPTFAMKGSMNWMIKFMASMIY